MENRMKQGVSYNKYYNKQGVILNPSNASNKQYLNPLNYPNNLLLTKNHKYTSYNYPKPSQINFSSNHHG